MSISLITAFTFCSLLQSSLASQKAPLAPALFVFGDSLLDAGNNYFIRHAPGPVNYSPYGETYFHKPTGRFTNGRTIADFLALGLRIPLVPPSLQPGVNYTNGLNFASGGSGLLDSTSFGAAVLSMAAQLTQFHEAVSRMRSELGETGAKNFLAGSIYMLCSGSNDIGINYLQNSTYQRVVPEAQFIGSLMEEYKISIMEIYNEGGRKLAVFDLGILGCTPAGRLAASLLNETGCFTAANRLAELFNKELSSLLDHLRVELPEMKIAHGKTFTVFSNILDHFQAYGFVNSMDACCGAGPFNAVIGCGRPVPSGFPYKAAVGKAPSKFLFWDGSHPTESSYSLMFKKFWRGNESSIEPVNLWQLASMPV